MGEQSGESASEDVSEASDFDAEIRFATSAAPSCAFPPDTVEAKLSAMVSARQYQLIARRSREMALQHYQDSLRCDIAALVANRQEMEKEFGTANDQEDGAWRLPPDSLSDLCDLQLLKEVRRLEKKLENIGAEIAEVKGRVAEKQETLEVVLAQNQQLGLIRDA
jgi:hypothetical protein